MLRILYVAEQYMFYHNNVTGPAWSIVCVWFPLLGGAIRTSKKQEISVTIPEPVQLFNNSFSRKLLAEASKSSQKLKMPSLEFKWQFIGNASSYQLNLAYHRDSRRCK